MSGQKYSAAERRRLINRIKQMMMDDGFKGDLGRFDREKMASVLNSEGYRTSEGREMTYSTVTNWINEIRKPRAGRAQPVREVYKKQTGKASNVDHMAIIRALVASGVDDMTLGSVVRSLL